MKVGFVGLGQMGRAMAARLIEAGHELIVYNRSQEPARALAEKGAAVASDASGVLGAEVVITMLADDAAIEAVWIRGGLVRKMPTACVHLNMATVSLAMGQQMARLHREAGNGYVSAPVFGRPHAATAGQLDIVAAGAAAALERCKPLFTVLGKQSFYVGAEPWLANAVKIARNFLLATVVESLGEAFALVRKSGVDPALFLNIITTTSFNAPAYKSYGQRMVEKDPSFIDGWLTIGQIAFRLKDVEIAENAFKRVLELMPEHHIAWSALGALYMDSKQWEAAQEALEHAIKLNPQNWQLLARLAKTLVFKAHHSFTLSDDEKQAALSQAKTLIDAAIQQSPDTVPLYIRKAEIAEALNDPKEMKEALQKALTIDPLDPVAQRLKDMLEAAKDQSEGELGKP